MPQAPPPCSLTLVTPEHLNVYLVVAPEPGQAIGVHDAEDFALRILPADVVLVPAVRQELVDVVPQQPAV